ncbi:MAG: tyrosine--tRNA ligase [Bacilli bacterium]|nr:tyrosine--tRNA ligase [Bacilli bacterium]MDD4734405.1 tyrosine--tRNA ligase [Bacilli bacterium]
MKLYDDLKWRGLIKDISSPDLEEKLNKGGMTFYIGTDPTADSMHIGHLSSFLISKRLKDAGHNPLLLVGGATGLIGDPRPTSERSMITKEEVEKNIKGLRQQAEKIFGFEVVNNYDWSKDINFIDYLRDYGKYFSINYMLDKDIIRRRLDSGITYTEFSYMILQALDFLHLFEDKNCTLQVAGSDQWGNITAGIDLIRKKTGKEVYGFTMPLVTTKSGVKFGKSEGNALWLDESKTSSYELYQYLINVEDEMVIDYLKIFTFLSKEEIKKYAKTLIDEPHLRLPHKALAKEIIIFLHGEKSYLKAIKISESLFGSDIKNLSAKDIELGLKDVPHFETEEKTIIDILIENDICASKREAREFINSNAISINGEKIVDENQIITKDMAIDNRLIVIRKGKKKNYLGIIK